MDVKDLCIKTLAFNAKLAKHFVLVFRLVSLESILYY